MDYSQTLNLPKTEFPMRGNLPQREPEILARQEADEMYKKLMEQNEGKPLFILHDGPPYANGDMHMGHALNKTLKDVITRFKNMDGFKAPYIHGWDTHGLPIERQAIASLGINRHEVDTVQFRNLCRDFALKYVNLQMNSIKRLGALGKWEDPYLTLDPKFEAKQIEIFGKMAEKGYIYKGLKPIYWCPDCETALAEAEIEYQEDKTNSIYVKFAVKEDGGVFDGCGVPKEKINFVIWTTTTWTLPGNVAIALNGAFTYDLVEADGEYFIIADELVDAVMKAGNYANYQKLCSYQGSELENIRCAHPFIDRDSVVILGDHVTLDAGTGCVHTAPGHGLEDYIACQQYKDIPVIVPVDEKGYLNELAGEFAGLYYEKANAKIIDKLTELSALFAVEEIIHQYPHCWRCHDAIVYRAAEQWFASVDSIKDEAVRAIQNVTWIPKWGEDRITGMVQDRSDWCISRQRTWGVPIPIFYCAECGKELINNDTIKAVSSLFSEKGSNAWYELPAEEILPAGTVCPVCGHTHFTKEKDIMDVWFDSGSSHTAVLEVKEGLHFPADLYLEGNDQYRGWFQSSLLTSIAARGEAPYKSVITHGMIVDASGEKMSKSKGNGISPQDIIKDYGADVLRLWVVSADYKTDMHISKDILKQLSEAYRKIRNTARYILGNLDDFEPDRDSIAVADMAEIDRWAMTRLDKLVEKTLAGYRSYEFHSVFHSIHNFCVVDMSNFYLDVIKDRLYTEKANSTLRRSAQTAMYRILDSLVRLLTPILAFTCEEIWSYMPHSEKDNQEFVILNEMPTPNAALRDETLEEKWNTLLSVRSDISKALEAARNAKVIGHSLGAEVTLFAEDALLALLEKEEENLATYLIVSKVSIKSLAEAPADAETGETGIKVVVTQAPGKKCERCWVISETVGEDSQHPTLCKRCTSNLQ
ncbi:MAG: isoleucine--tRNA ligase [Ruminococcaceae bacterium]|nr:isoleucine--tRNA ligase [Oscillospiraceae bacterium]